MCLILYMFFCALELFGNRITALPSFDLPPHCPALSAINGILLLRCEINTVISFWTQELWHMLLLKHVYPIFADHDLEDVWLVQKKPWLFFFFLNTGTIKCYSSTISVGSNFLENVPFSEIAGSGMKIAEHTLKRARALPPPRKL